MDSATIEHHLQHRGAWLKPRHGRAAEAEKNQACSQLIASDYVEYEHLREMIFNLGHVTREEEALSIYGHPEMAPLLVALETAGIVTEAQNGGVAIDSKARRYLAGGWLEELAFLAAREAGADEAVYGQQVGWEFQGFSGENEIDLLMRHGEKLAFVSCKALRSHLDASDRKLRNRLMEAVHEADNLADHFGHRGDRVAVLVTTDLFDEMKNVPRYASLMGKAAVLDVRVISLQDLKWDRLVHAMVGLMK